MSSVSNFYGHDIISHSDYWALAAEDVQRVRFVSGHFGYDFARRFMSGRYSFTFLRDPVERVLSFYNYARREADNYAYPVFQMDRKYPIEDFLAECKSNVTII